MPPHPDFVHHKPDDPTDDQQWNPENPRRLNHAVPAHAGGLGGMNRAKHRHHIPTDTDILAQVDHAEKADEVMLDRRIIVRVHVSEEGDDVVVGDAGDVHVAEKDDHIMVDRALSIHAAKKAHGVVNRTAFGHVDVAPKLNDIVVRMDQRWGRQQGGKDQPSGKELSKVHGASPVRTDITWGKFPPQAKAPRQPRR